MKIKFDVIEIAKSPLHEADKTYSRPAIVNPQTIPTRDIMEKASEECTLTPIDISAVVGSLSRHLRKQLLQGNAVHIDGIGTFSLALKLEDATKPKADITARDVQVAGINFNPDRALLSEVQHEVGFERSSVLRSSKVSEGEIVLRLKGYFEEHSSITKRAFQELFGLKYGRATKLLLSLEDKNKIRPVRVGQTNFYYPGETL